MSVNVAELRSPFAELGIDEVAQLRIAHAAAIQTLVRAIESKDPFTAGHYDTVARLAVDVGRRMELLSGDIERLRMGALVMDVGKIAIPTEIWTKPGPLDPNEEAIVREHVAIGARIVEPIVEPWDLAEIVFQHHERYDGSGYPRGLAGDAISVEARILGACDSFVAMTSERAFRQGLEHTEAIAQMRELAGLTFDPAVVLALIEAAGATAES
ncbi:HD-GYP domain-containing protein [bacterium]|nr:HD-GYP domain-containing protein [bacterium]